MASSPEDTDKWTLPAALALFVLIAGVVLNISLGQLDGQLFYPLDDTYIHMSIAKNWVEHDVWGLTQYAFSSTTSSPLWTFVMALAFSVFGVSTLTPLIMSLLTGFATTWIFHTRIRHWLSPIPALLLTASFLYLTPVVPLSILGMEHILHIGLTLLFVDYGSRLLSGEVNDRKILYSFLLLASVLPVIRLEAIFIILAFIALFAFHRDWKLAIGILVLSLIPLGLYGLYAWSNGWYPVPNSIILKSNTYQAYSLLHQIQAYFWKLGPTLYDTPHMVLLFILNLFSVFHFYSSDSNRNPAHTRATLVSLIFIAGSVAHLMFSKTGWFFRYEAYLVGLGIMALAPYIQVMITEITAKLRDIDQSELPAYPLKKQSFIAAILIIGFVISSPMVLRAKQAHSDT